MSKPRFGEAERASKAWLNMLSANVRDRKRSDRPEPMEPMRKDEWRWVTLGDGRSVYRKISRDYDLRSMLAAPQISADYEMYQCPITDKPVEGRVAHRENLKQHGCRVLEPGETSEYKKDRPKFLEQKLRKDVHEATKEAVKEWVW